MLRTVDLLSAHPFLQGLPDPWLQRLSGRAHPVVRHAGQRLFHGRRPADRFWLLRSGRVELDIAVPGLGDIVIETIEAGTVLGWSWLFPPYRGHFGAVPVEQTFPVELDATGVRRLTQLYELPAPIEPAHMDKEVLS
ncbi:cyclic nucleotide-binding domain-containing protein [Micromonospora purpureochromogenes]|uniref:cyclic nucleotide-binding domain-containing protein n=1 Tax=Micromonospora purpureochromogenes TaxID=47872 RepID=UPI00332FFBB1